MLTLLEVLQERHYVEKRISRVIQRPPIQSYASNLYQIPRLGRMVEQ